MATTTRQTIPPVPTRNAQETGADLGQGLYISCQAQDVDTLVDIFTRWFATRDDITLVDAGSSEKGRGFVILEWDAQVNRRVLNWLKQQETVDDYSLYTAFHGQEEQA